MIKPLSGMRVSTHLPPQMNDKVAIPRKELTDAYNWIMKVIIIALAGNAKTFTLSMDKVFDLSSRSSIAQ